MEQIACNKMFGGEQRRYKHSSSVLSCDMTFSIYLPHQVFAVASTDVADTLKLPVLYWLSGLTCNDENFVQKAGAQRIASELGLVIVTADTSPRGEGVADDAEGAYDFGLGAGFYLNATESPWAAHYQMYDYIVSELPALIAAHFPVDPQRQAISGHSMGGHGALTIGLKNPQQFKSISAFAPIVSPMNCPWGLKALSGYLGEKSAAWAEYDAVALIEKEGTQTPLMVDQGSGDDFLQEQLKPELLLEACTKAGYPIRYNLRDGYDHSYFFIASFIEEHLRFHAEVLN